MLGQHQELRYRLVTMRYEYYISSRIVTVAHRGPAGPDNLGWIGARSAIDHQAKIERSVISADPGGECPRMGGIFRGELSGGNVRGEMSYTHTVSEVG